MHSLRIQCGLSFFIGAFVFHAYAFDNITVTVKTEIAAAKALGFQVGDAKSGGMGTVYKGLGPKNKHYLFGYRKDLLFGKDIRCGSKTLNKDSTITLVNQGTRCIILVSD